MNYKILLIIPMLLLLTSIAILGYSYANNGEWFQRSIELKGGTVIIINTDQSYNIGELQEKLSSKFGSISVRELRGVDGYGIHVEIEKDADPQQVLNELNVLGIDTTNSSIESIESSLGETFWSQAQLSIIIAFILMGIIVFLIFRTFVPSIAVILAAFSDILVTLALMQVFGIELSLASFAALLMLIGYSIDTDIMLTTRLLKRGGEVVKNVKNAFKTGITMSGTTIGVLGILILASTSLVIIQIASILFIGLVVDIINTWLQNSVLLRWYIERKGVEI